MKLIDGALACFYFFLCIFLIGSIRLFLSAQLLQDKLIYDRNLDQAAEDALYESVEGVYDDLEPIINRDYLLLQLEKQIELAFPQGKAIPIPMVILVEKEQFHIWNYEKQIFQTISTSGLDNIGRIDILRQQMEHTLNSLSHIKRYQIYIPYIEQEVWYQILEKTGLWFVYESQNHTILGKTYDYITFSGSRFIRKRTMKK